MMNRLLQTAARSAAPSLRDGHSGAASSRARFFAARHFSDSSDPPSQPEGDDATFTIGTVKGFNPKLNYGFIVPDGVDRWNHDNKDLIFFHRNDIKIPGNPGEGNPGEGEMRFWPMARQGDRVRFRVGASQGGQAKGKAIELTRENGKLIPPFHPQYLDGYVRRLKGDFGRELYEVFETSKDHRELETRIMTAYDNVKDNIEKKREQVQRAQEIYSKEEEVC